ncbi:MAG: folate-binding protein YgfZ [Phreatobacter sp.]|uniref:CAF17-like 4Fe-4S cluster assembly/insertion protein YgfZ n=1 Tax=Phreatobacter sp. TaxID=1966341 RepID=UPI001A647A86|nr:hypothetical protein [Phreatobacter sp.]MBL8571883.1 folate-binding protein YgfZ [Phreatobacter sp.]
MSPPTSVVLDSRAVLAVTGEDRRAFLQGLISNDVNKVAADHAVHAAFLTAQGRFLHEFFVAELGDRLLLDAEAPRLEDLRRRLAMYKLRAKVALEPLADGFAVVALIGDGAAAALGCGGAPGDAVGFAGGIAFVDPRLAELGLRAILPPTELSALAARGFVPGRLEDYDALRLTLGVGDGSRDLAVEHALLLENGFDELNGVDWKKGCYIGQELTARMKYRALVKRRLTPVRIEGPRPAPGTPVTLDGAEAGEMRSSSGTLGLALLRIEALEALRARGGTLVAGEARLAPQTPAWHAGA